MRRKYFGLAIAAFATLGPMQAWGGDREIAEQIIKRLKTSRDSGALQDFTLDMKVDNGVVLFRGNVSEEAQKDLLLKATDGIEGISHVVDEVSVTSETAKVVKPKAPLAVTDRCCDVKTFLTQAPVKQVALAAGKPRADQGRIIVQRRLCSCRQCRFAFRASQRELQVMPGEILRTAAVEPATDTQIVSAVVSALNQAKKSGQLKGFGVDVKSQNGVLQLTGRAGSAAQRDCDPSHRRKRSRCGRCSRSHCGSDCSTESSTSASTTFLSRRCDVAIDAGCGRSRRIGQLAAHLRRLLRLPSDCPP